MTASRSGDRLASHLRAAIETRNDALVSDIYAGFKAAGLPLPELAGVVYEVPAIPASCIASLSPAEPDHYDVVLSGPRGVAHARYAAPRPCRWLFRHDANEIINPRRSTY